MKSYVGLDVSLKQTSICVVDESGSVVREGVVISDPEAIVAFVRLNAPGAARIGLETGPTTTWLWTELKRLDLPVICIDARHAKAVLKMQINKIDRNDAADIARIMQTGWFKEVRVKDIDSHLVKALLVSRALLVKIKRDLENQIRGLLKNLGLVIGRGKFNVFAVRTKDDRGEPDTQTRNREQNRHFSEVTSTYPPSSLSGRQRTTFAQAGFLQVWANSDVLCRSPPA
jgi:transposase